MDLYFAWGIGCSTFYSNQGVLWPATEAIDEVFHIGLPIEDNGKLEQLSRGFFEQSNGLFDGLVMVMNGLAVWTHALFENEVEKRKDYMFRKGGFAIIVLAGCDADARFISATANHSGSTHDIIPWNNSKLCKAVEYERHLLAKVFFSLTMKLLQITLIFLVHGQTEDLIGTRNHSTTGSHIHVRLWKEVLESLHSNGEYFGGSLCFHFTVGCLLQWCV
jgi:hypothetical protein